MFVVDRLTGLGVKRGFAVAAMLVSMTLWLPLLPGFMLVRVALHSKAEMLTQHVEAVRHPHA